MKIIFNNQSMLTGINHRMEIDIGARSEEEFQSHLDRYRETRDYIQDVFPYLNADEREFIKTGITPEEWERYISEEDPFPENS